MGAIAGVLGSADEDPKGLTEELLLALRHRGTRTRIVTHEGNLRVGTFGAVGYSSNISFEGHLLDSPRGSLAFDGSLFHGPCKMRPVYAHLMEESSRKASEDFMLEPGLFAVLYTRGNRMYAFRDPNGMKPLYYAKGRKVVAFASERKALWRIGMTNVNRVLPGYLYSSNRRGTTLKRIVHIRRPREDLMTLLASKRQLKRLLSLAIRRVTTGFHRVAVAFSGGLDSALTATLAKTCTEVSLVSVGLSGSPELLTAERYARELHLPITVQQFDANSLEEYVRRIVWLIEEPSLMKVSVAIPLHWAAMVASRLGFTVMLCGQGSDELYGGYYKYARTLDTRGRRALAIELYRSVIEASQVNYERDEQATAPLGVELRTPFSDLDVIQFSLTIPSEYKVRPGNDQTRKWILRSVADDTGLPEDMVWRRKKAIQHGTGVENAIRKLARRKNLTAESYLAKIHEEVRELESMP